MARDLRAMSRRSRVLARQAPFERRIDIAERFMPARKQVRTAMLLVDFINLFDFDNAKALGRRAVRAARNAAALKASAKKRGMPCIYANDNFGNWISEFSSLTHECLRRKGASGAIARTLRPEAGDLSVLKPRHSAFYGTPLEFLLEELAATRLIVAGITVDSCVFATAQDAHVRKFELWIPANCSAGFCAAHERTSLALMARTLHADIRPTIPDAIHPT